MSELNAEPYSLTGLTELEFKLIINALKVWRGDFTEHEGTKPTNIWKPELDKLLAKIGYSEIGWR